MISPVPVSIYKPELRVSLKQDKIGNERLIVQAAHLQNFLDSVPLSDTVDFSDPANAFTYAVHLIQSDQLYIRGLDRFVLFVLRQFASLGQTLGIGNASNCALKAYTEVARTCIRQQKDMGNIEDSTPKETTNRDSTGSEDSEFSATYELSNKNLEIIDCNPQLSKVFRQLPWQEKLNILQEKDVLNAMCSNQKLSAVLVTLSEKDRYEIIKKINLNNFSVDEEIII